jgi:catecholate siderophore receptor
LLAPAVVIAAQPADAADADARQLDRVVVRGDRARDYTVREARGATRTDTPLRDVPQAVTVVTETLIRDQAMDSIADVVRYAPGVGIAQGEGNRDAVVFRGTGSTGDFFVDGVRDDVQYYRDLYNIERVEILRGPSGMAFGRGTAGGAINRVTKQADGRAHRALGAQLDSQGRRRATVDVGGALDDAWSLRLTGLAENSDTYRDDVNIERYGVNPTLTWRGATTRVELGVEHVRDDRTADRGVPSYQGRPLATDPSTFFGDPALSPTWARVSAFTAAIEHDFAGGARLRNRTRIADYDKLYQNVYPGAVTPDGREVSLSAYNNATQRRNLFNQTDLIVQAQTGAVAHTLLVGTELSRQATDNLRLTGYFTGISPTTTTVRVPVTDPRPRQPIVFRAGPTDADNTGVARGAAIYVQDQVTLTPTLKAIVGTRYDRLAVDFTNRRNGARITRTDGLVSPRAGLVYAPVEPLSLYASYSKSLVPRAGEQLASLTPGNAALEPEAFVNREVGAKWDVTPRVSADLAVYRLDRRNVAIANPAVPTELILVDGQRTQGAELGLAGRVTERWSVVGGYAYQDGTITRTQSAAARAGARLAQLPRHSASLWNRVDLTPAWGMGLGIVYRGAMFASTDNTVTLPGYTRVDAAAFYRPSPHWGVQLNLENVFDRAYYASANGNNNITPGAPRGVTLSVNVDL